MIVKGDQLPLAIKLTNNDTVVTPNQIIGLRVKINTKIYNYPENITYNSTSQRWNVYLSQEDTLNIGDIMAISSQANFGGSPNLIGTTETVRQKVKPSLFEKPWNLEITQYGN